ncbi:hypothetical protein OHB12_19165 [Nocardia sp. NBC_01730]|uniref:hypothetical protein n=1 Tax=Nocardia sp. NBC_01730 TaxID=2975998 RepID=UPI002E1307CA|nr:hypothetical protein OHB12_19165 [Nocardia sp. NBC_01730]
MRVRGSISESSVSTLPPLRRDQLDPDPALRATDPALITHRVTYSDRLKVFLGAGETVDSFLRPLRRLDGYHRYSVNMTRLAAAMRPADISPVISSAPGRNYLQCTGSAGALAIELRSTVDAAPRQFAVGLPGDRIGAPSIDVPVPAGVPAPLIYPDELFTAEQAAEIFTAYFETGDVPPYLQLRETTA